MLADHLLTFLVNLWFEGGLRFKVKLSGALRSIAFEEF